MRLKSVILSILAIGSIVSQQATAHDQWSINIGFGNPYPATRYYSPPVGYYSAPVTTYYAPPVTTYYDSVPYSNISYGSGIVYNSARYRDVGDRYFRHEWREHHGYGREGYGRGGWR